MKMTQKNATYLFSNNKPKKAYYVSGNNSGARCLSYEKAEKIRKEYKMPPFLTKRELAKKYEVSERTIASILSNKSWEKF